MSSSPPNSSNTLHAPPGLEHVDTAVNLKALAELQLRDNQRDTDANVTISIIPPTAGFNVTFDDKSEVDEHLLHTKGKYALPPYFRLAQEVDGEDNQSLLAVVLLPDYLLEESEPAFFLPPGLLEDEEEDELRLLQKLDTEEREAVRRPCEAEHCLKGSAFELADAFSKDDVDHYKSNTLFSPVSTPLLSFRCISSTSSDTDTQSTISTVDLDSHVSRSASPDSMQSSTSTGSSRSAEKKPGPGGRDDCAYFHASESKGILLSDVRALKPGSLLTPEEEVLTSWGAAGCPTWIRIIINQHGYHKKSFFIPTRCYCSNITRAKLAYDIASLLELHLTAGTVRPGFAEDPKRRKDLSGLYLHSLRRNHLDETMVWRISVSDSAVSWTGKSKARLDKTDKTSV